MVLHSSPWNTAVTEDQLISCVSVGHRLLMCLMAQREIPTWARGLHDWGPVGWERKLYDKSTMWQGSCAVVGVDVLPSAGTGAPTRMRLEISTCILLTICHSLQYQSRELASAITVLISSLCWILILGKSYMWKANCRGEAWCGGKLSLEYFVERCIWCRVKINVETW